MQSKRRRIILAPKVGDEIQNRVVWGEVPSIVVYRARDDLWQTVWDQVHVSIRRLSEEQIRFECGTADPLFS